METTEPPSELAVQEDASSKVRQILSRRAYQAKQDLSDGVEHQHVPYRPAESELHAHYL